MKFSKALRHIDIEDVKSKHLEEVAVKKLKEERLKEQDEQMKAEYEKWKSNWRAIGFDLKPKSVSENKKTKRKSFKKIMKEAMKTSAIMQQTETETVEVSDIDLTNPVSYANSITSSEEGGFVSTTGSSFNQGAGVFANGSGSPNGGFNLGSDYLGFAFPPNQSSPTSGRAQFPAQDLTNVDTISAFGIRGNVTNGGSTPLVGGGITEPGLRLQYKLSGMGTYVDFNVKHDGSIDNRVDNVLIPGGIATDSFTVGKNIVINIPSYIKTTQTEIRLISKDIGFHGSPVYGVKNFKFQRRTPQNVFVALDDPEAMSFIRVGQQPSVKRKSAREREEDVVSLLKGGRDYTNKILGMQFPGSNPKLSFSINLPNQDIADIQQQQRSQTFNQIKDRFASDPGIDGRIETLRTTQDEPTATQDEPTASPIGFDQVKTQYMSDEPADDFNSIDGEKVFDDYDDARAAYDASWKQYENDLDQARKAYGREFYQRELKRLQNSWDKIKNPRSPRPVFDAERQKSLENTKWGQIAMNVNKSTPAGKNYYAVLKRGGEINDKFFAANNQLNAINKEQKSMDQYLASLPPNLRDQALNGTAPPDFSMEKLLASLLGGKILKAGTKMIAAGRALNKWWNKGRNERVPNESTASWKDLLKDDRSQLTRTDAAFKAGETGLTGVRPFKAFSPKMVKTGPTAAVRQAGERLTKPLLLQKNKKVSQNKKSKINLKNLRNNPQGEIVLPFTGKRIPTAAAREKQVDDLFRKLEFGESKLMKPKQFFNPKDIKPTFPENPPPEMVDGLHPEYGKRANRYKKLDPHSANSMPLTGDPEIDAVVKKQKTINKIKKMARNK